MEDMASVHLSISKHSVISPLFRRRGHFFLPVHHRPLLIFAFPFCSSLFSRFIDLLPPLLLYPIAFIFFFSSSILLLFFFHSTLLHPLLPPPAAAAAPRRLLRSQWNSPFSNKTKAAQSITHWLIKQDQNAAALTSTQHHHDTGSHWSGEQQDLRKG